MNLATAEEFRDEIARLQAEIERLQSQPCPYVTGNVTKYCTLTPMTLTDAERGLLDMLADHPVTHQIMPHEVATLRGLLDRTDTGGK